MDCPALGSFLHEKGMTNEFKDCANCLIKSWVDRTWDYDECLN